MKKLTLLLLLSLLIRHESFAQIAVTAPTLEVMAAKNNASIIKQLAEASKQSSTLKESADLLKKSTELYEKVNQKIKAIADIKKLTEDQIQLVKEAGLALNESRKIGAKNPKMLANHIENIDRVVSANRKNVELMNSVMTEGLRLSDGERLKIITQVSENTAKNRVSIYALNRRFQNHMTYKRIIFNK